MPKNLLNLCYEPGEEKKYFGNLFLFKGKQYPHAKETLIAETKTPEGVLVRVFNYNLPAQFWTFKVTNKNAKTFKLQTGSGSWDNYEPLYKLLIDTMLKVEIIT